MRRYVATTITSVIAVTLVLTRLVTGVDLVDGAGRLLEGMSRNRLGTSIFATVLILLGLGIDSLALKQRMKYEAEAKAMRLIVFKSTMRTVQELVNNALNQMQLFRLDAEGRLPEESLRSFDDLVSRTAAELKALADRDTAPDRDSSISHLLDNNQRSPISRP